jgi:hypothetical protein
MLASGKAQVLPPPNNCPIRIFTSQVRLYLLECSWHPDHALHGHDPPREVAWQSTSDGENSLSR